jgi:heme oxygenase
VKGKNQEAVDTIEGGDKAVGAPWVHQVSVPIGADARTESLSARLRRETARIHRRAERCGFVQAMVQGKLEASAYVGYLCALYPFYRCLEGLLDENRRHPALVLFDWGPLMRASRLATDLETIEPAPTPTPDSVSRAVARLERLGAGEPATLLGHAYARYLGDLHGGRILGSLADRHFGFARHGLTFHQFDADPAKLAGRFRHALDRARIFPPEADAIVREAIASFQFALELFEEHR